MLATITGTISSLVAWATLTGILIVAWPKCGVATLVVVLSIVLLVRGIVMRSLAFVVRAATHDAV